MSNLNSSEEFLKKNNNNDNFTKADGFLNISVVDDNGGDNWLSKGCPLYRTDPLARTILELHAAVEAKILLWNALPPETKLIIPCPTFQLNLNCRVKDTAVEREVAAITVGNKAENDAFDKAIADAGIEVPDTETSTTASDDILSQTEFEDDAPF